MGGLGFLNRPAGYWDSYRNDVLLGFVISNARLTGRAGMWEISFLLDTNGANFLECDCLRQVECCKRSLECIETCLLGRKSILDTPRCRASLELTIFWFDTNGTNFYEYLMSFWAKRRISSWLGFLNRCLASHVEMTILFWSRMARIFLKAPSPCTLLIGRAGLFQGLMLCDGMPK
jgi:hypothetical protein